MTIRRNSQQDAAIASMGEQLRTVLNNMGMSIEDHEPAPSPASAAVKAWIAFRERPSPSRERVAKHALAALNRYFEDDLAEAVVAFEQQLKADKHRTSASKQTKSMAPSADAMKHSDVRPRATIAAQRAAGEAILAAIPGIRERILAAAILAHELPKNGTFAMLMSRVGQFVPDGPFAAALRSWNQLVDEPNEYKLRDAENHVRVLERFASDEDARLRRPRASEASKSNRVTLVFTFGECEHNGDMSNYVRHVEDLGLVVIGRTLDEESESCRIKASALNMDKAQQVMKMFRSGQIDFCDNLRIAS